MAAATPRGQVLGGFKRLMRARANVFREDHEALIESRVKLREEFLKNNAATAGEPAPADVADAHAPDNELVNSGG